MDIIIREISYESLIDVGQIFSLDNQLAFVSYLDKEPIDEEYYVKPYVLEENITDIESVLDQCEVYASDYMMNPIHIINWNDFCLFWIVMRNIVHKRKIGKQVSDLEYVYEILKEYNNVEYTTTDRLGGFTISCDVIYVKLEDIDFHLYKDYDEFVLSVNSKVNNYFTHWHLQNCEEAIYELKNIFEEGISIIYKKNNEKFIDILFSIFVKDINQLIKYQNDSKYRIITIKNEISR